MLEHYSDHAANERTFLAWVRTAIAVMAFGFLVARFNLFLRMAAQSLSAHGGASIVLHGSGFGGVAGVVLVAAGTVMILVAAIRFVRTARAIDSPTSHHSGPRADLVLAVLMTLLGIAMLVYLSETLATGI